jgi:probable HAF family extracellular repeat protein
MTNRNLILALCAMCVTIAPLALPAVDPASVSGYKDVNAPNAEETDPYAVNNQGVIAGDYVDKKRSLQHGMILKGRKLTTVDRKNCTATPGSNAIAFYGINNKGTVVGWCLDTRTGADDAFAYVNGRFVPISPPGATSTEAHGINDKGQIVGTYFDTASVQHGFLLSSGHYTTLDVTGGDTKSDAWAINNNSMITLVAVNSSGGYDSFLFNGKMYTPIDVPGAVQSSVAAINSYGDRIYTIIDSQNNMHGAFFLNVSGGSYTTFDDPNGVNTTAAFGLNDKLGTNKVRIVGRYAPANSAEPQPASQGYEAIGCCRGIPPDRVRSH